MKEGGDRGKAPNKTGTQSKRQTTQSPPGATKKSGTRKKPAKTTTRSADK